MKRSIIVVILILSCMPHVPIRAQPEEAAPYFEYPTETWIIESQDYFGSWLEWMFIPVDGQAGDKRTWNFTWTMNEYDEPENGTANPLYEIREAEGNETKLREIYDRIEPLQFKTWGDFKSDVSRLDRYPITPEDKEEFKGLKANIDLLNDDSGAFLVSFKDKWKLGKKLTIGFASTIIYTMASNSITFTGGTKEAPISFWDLWNASNVLGWNVSAQTNENISKPLGRYDTQYVFSCNIVAGDGDTETWFNDSGKQIVFADGIVTANWKTLFRLYAEATVTLGKVLSYEDKTTYEGCSIINLEDTYTATQLLHTSGGSARYLYGCYFLGNNDNVKITYIARNNRDMWNCFLDKNMAPHYSVSSVSDFYNLIRSDKTQIGLGRLPVYQGNLDYFERAYIMGCSKAIYVGGNDLYYYWDITTRGNLYDINFWGYTGNLHLINCDLENWNLLYTGNPSSGEAWREYTFNIMVCDNAGSPVEGATATLTYEGLGGGTVGPFSTYANGSVTEQVLTKGIYNQTGGDAIYAYEPYTLTITKDGYIDYSVSFNISERISWVVGLEPLDVIFSMELLVLAAVSMIFMLMMLFSSQPGMGVISGTLAFMFWFATGMYYMYTNIADQYAIGYLFIGLGLICGIFTVYCGLKTLDPKASKDSDYL